MSKIIKSGFVSFLDQKKTIETIDTHHKRILNKEPKSEDTTEEGFSEVDFTDLLTEEAPEPEPEEEDYEKVQEEMILSAQEQAEAIILEAQKAADEIREEAETAGYQVGLDQGREAADKQIEENNKLMQEQLETYEAEYQKQVAAIEPQMVKLVIDLVEKLVGNASASPETISFLIAKGFEQIELTGHICIKVSEFDYQYVMTMQHDIFKNLSTKTTTEILLDYSLAKNDCIIETDLGNINCSLGQQLKGLLGELSLIQKSLMKE